MVPLTKGDNILGSKIGGPAIPRSPIANLEHPSASAFIASDINISISLAVIENLRWVLASGDYKMQICPAYVQPVKHCNLFPPGRGSGPVIASWLVFASHRG